MVEISSCRGTCLLKECFCTCVLLGHQADLCTRKSSTTHLRSRRHLERLLYDLSMIWICHEGISCKDPENSTIQSNHVAFPSSAHSAQRNLRVEVLGSPFDSCHIFQASYFRLHSPNPHASGSVLTPGADLRYSLTLDHILTAS